MSPKPGIWRHRVAATALVAVAQLMITVGPATAGPVQRAVTDASTFVQPVESQPSRDELVQPEQLAQLLAKEDSHRPLLVHIGFEVLFLGGHIPGSRHIGPASTPDGLANLKKLLLETPRDREIVLYCGCCPWTDCPNVRPALEVMRESRLKNVRLLYLPNSLRHDWIEKGLPISRGDQ